MDQKNEEAFQDHHRDPAISPHLVGVIRYLTETAGIMNALRGLKPRRRGADGNASSCQDDILFFAAIEKSH
jgi:hypothetical protein